MKHIHDFTSPTGIEHRIHVSDDELITEEFTPTHIDNLHKDVAHRIRTDGIPTKHGFARHAAHVPLNIWTGWRMEWRRKYRQYFTWPTYEAMKLNSPDYALLRTLVKHL